MSEAEFRFVLDGLVQGVRNDGRGLNVFRGFAVTPDVIPQANGSARVSRKGELDVTIGVKCELSDETQVRLSVEQRPDLEAILREFVIGNFGSSLILPTPWLLNIDVLVSKDNGALLDAIVVGIYAALSTVRLPQCVVTLDEGRKRVFMDDKPQNALKLDLSELPLVLTFGLIHGNLLVVDPDSLEEQLLTNSADKQTASALVAVFATATGLKGVRKFGLGCLDAQYLAGLLGMADKRIAALRESLQVAFQ